MRGGVQARGRCDSTAFVEGIPCFLQIVMAFLDVRLDVLPRPIGTPIRLQDQLPRRPHGTSHAASTTLDMDSA